MKKIAKSSRDNFEISPKKSEILSNEPDIEFDELIQLASKICDVPMVFFAVNENGNDWVKSQVGFENNFQINYINTKNESAKNNKMILTNQDNAQLEFNFPFFLELPILHPLSQKKLGNLCLCDTEDRVLKPEQFQSLQVVGRQLQNLIQIKLIGKEHKQIKQHFEDVQKIAKIGAWEIDLVDFNHKWSSEMFNLFNQRENQGTPDWNVFLEKIHPEDIEAWKSTFKKCKESDKPQTVRFRSVLPDRTLWIEAVGQQIKDKNGQVVKIHGTCQDITTKILFEKQIKEKNSLSIQKTQAVSLSEITSLMVSELTNPLSVIDSSIQFLQSIKVPDKKIEAKLNTISKASARIAKITSRLNRFSTNKKSNLYKSCNVSDILPDIIHFVEHKIQLHNINLITVAQTEDQIYCNPNEIQQAVLHLINNSIDAIKEDNYPWIEVKYFNQNNQIIIQITDSGSGIPFELERKIFDPFYTTKKTTTGHGMGLALSKGIIEAHGGTLKINRKNKNTCFEICLEKEQAKLNNAS